MGRADCRNFFRRPYTSTLFAENRRHLTLSLLQISHIFLKHISTLLIVVKLSPACTCRRKRTASPGFAFSAHTLTASFKSSQRIISWNPCVSAASLIFSLCLPNEYQISLLFRQMPQSIHHKLDSFVISAADQKCRTVHCLNALDCCIRIGSLGIIVICNTVFLCYIFNTMLHCREMHRYSYGCCPYQHHIHNKPWHCCHYILKLCVPRSFSSSVLTDCFFSFHLVRRIMSSIQINSLFQFTLTEKYTTFGITFFPNSEPHPHNSAHNNIFCLILCDHSLHTDILFHRMMTVQMIRCDIQDCTDLWCKIHEWFPAGNC